MRLLLLIILLLSSAVAQETAPLHSAPDTVRVDSSAPKPDAADSSRVKKVDPARIWTTWKDLSRAIALRALDGPEDILEKAEIIEDRIDDLASEHKRLKETAKEWKNRHQSLEIQLEVLDDLAEIQRGGDLQLQQRLHNLRVDLRKTAKRRTAFETSLKDLEEELGRLTKLLQHYQDKAEAIRRREEGSR